MKLNGKDVYFKSKPYITYIYELDPNIDAEDGLSRYVHKTVKQLQKFREHVQYKLKQRAAKLFSIFVYRTENGNFDLDFLNHIYTIFKLGIS
jgi:hypothetical protein